MEHLTEDPLSRKIESLTFEKPKNLENQHLNAREQTKEYHNTPLPFLASAFIQIKLYSAHRFALGVEHAILHFQLRLFQEVYQDIYNLKGTICSTAEKILLVNQLEIWCRLYAK